MSSAKHPILVYRDRILPPSELSFMRRQYSAFQKLEPVWVGRHLSIDADALGAQIQRLGGNGLSGDISRIAYKLFGHVPDIDAWRQASPVLVHAQFGRGGALALPLARVLGIPLAVTFHGGDAHKNSHYRTFPPSLYRLRLEALKREAALIICVSDGVRATLIGRGFPALKLSVLPIGVEWPPTPGTAREPPYLLFVGRFVPKKGLSTLIAAWRQIASHVAPLELMLIGDGPERRATERAARDLPRVTFLGWQSPDNVVQWLRSASMLCIPSQHAPGGDAEGLPSVALEAMANGVPLIASTDAGLDRIVRCGSSGMLFRSGNSFDLAQAIVTLFHDPALRAEMALAARQLARRDFVAYNQSRKLEAALLSLLPNRQI